ncbi:hypothetical protein [Simiduia agarivorans]|uniref:DUF2846 domain-containing protein n=1 Tax=Simiduia agarivorans (strain DSM 21679 / JCM 13881 / BCRC 17597 / SA1) TaxID=1117647 RepID=K4KK19_SIMAS|nr:hypothetical protein [Simiduia agarivorans]AFU98575.1 hypothetical protein M5M_06900 [Simiduia agarivorans SA1 = DSM 21679]
MKLFKVLVLASLAVLVGCAGTNPMQVASNQEVVAAPADKAQVVFMRSSFLGHVISASLYDVTGGKTDFIGIIENDTKVVYDVAPGNYQFMVVSEAADFMNAELVAGKTYYAMVTPRMGAWKARFSLQPVRADGSTDFNTADKNFAQWQEKTKRVEMSDAARQWFEKNRASVVEKQEDYLPVFAKKDADDVKARTLLPSDGI